MDVANQQLLYVMERTGLNKSQFATYIGKQYKQVHAWATGQPIAIENVMLLLDVFDLNAEWFLRGRGPAPAIARIDPDEFKARMRARTAGATSALTEPAATTESPEPVEPEPETSVVSLPLPTDLRKFIAARKKVGDELADHEVQSLAAEAARDGHPKYEELLRRLRAKAKGKATKEAQPVDVEVPEGLQAMSVPKPRKR